MEEVLAKIRPHTLSSLPHQKTPAALLHALEATFREQNTERTPTAYFAALLTSIDGTLAKNDTNLGDGDVLPAEIYLLALVIPFVSPSVIRANLHTILSLTAPLFPTLMAYAPPLRSQLTIYSTIFLSLDRSQLETQGIRQSFASILQLCLDPRPKVRKKACGVVWDVLAAPPPPMARHPYADQVAEWIQSALGDRVIGNAPRSKSSGKVKDMSSATDAALHILFFLRPVLRNLPPSVSTINSTFTPMTHWSQELPFIAEMLLTLPCLGNPYLSQSTYNVLAELISAPAIGIQSAVSDQISGVIKSVLASPPSKSDTSFAPAWLNLLGNAMLAYHTTDPQACASESGAVLKAIWPFLGFSDDLTRKAAVQSLSTLSLCFTPDMIAQSISEARDGEASTPLNKLISQIMAGLDSLALVQAMPDLLALLSSLISNLRHRPSRASPSASEFLLLPLIRKVGDLRIQKGFEHKEAADVVLATSVKVLGPEVLLRTLPLNLEPADRYALRIPTESPDLAHLCSIKAQLVRNPERFFSRFWLVLTHHL
jgi:ribosomal RNA-processing protein 12